MEQVSSQSTEAESSAASSTSSESASTEKTKEKKETMDISALAMVIMPALKEPGRMLLATSLFLMKRAWFQVVMNCMELL